LAELETTLVESEPQQEHSLPQHHYYMPGQLGGEEEDGWGEKIDFIEGNDSIDTID
jgi:hypothetical protein